MSGELEFTWEIARDFANQILYGTTSKYLSDLEAKVLHGAWQNQTYEEMAELYNYGSAYLNRDVGNPLWKKLSQALNEKVSKTNFREALRRAWKNHASASIFNPTQAAHPDSNRSSLNPSGANSDPGGITSPSSTMGIEPPFAEGPVPPDSPFYMSRSNSEQLGYQSILKPGALLRVKAPNLMGKTSFLYQLLAYAQRHQYPTVYLDLRSIDRAILTDLDKLLRWLCLRVSRPLNIANRLNDYWDSEIFGSNDNCTAYFEEYLLQEIPYPLVLGLDNVDRIFPHPEITEDFFGMLRSWHEKGRISPIWQQLRLILVHSTEAYIPLDYNQSPFNTGVPIELPEFNQEQIATIAQLHHLSLSPQAISRLMQMIGGHPYLVRLTLYELSRSKFDSLNLEKRLEDLLATAPTDAGIYSNHLRRHWLTLQKNPELLQAFQRVITSSEAISLNPLLTYKLHSMGLIERRDNRVTCRCRLYGEYFDRVFSLPTDS